MSRNTRFSRLRAAQISCLQAPHRILGPGWCASNLSVAAVHAEAEGYKKNIPTVVIRPYFSPSFCCGATSCEVQMTEKFYEWNSWSMGVSGTYVKLMSTRCHFCFKHAEEVHRSFIDLTRGQTLVNCWIVTEKIGLW